MRSCNTNRGQRKHRRLPVSLILRLTVRVDVTCCRPEHPPHLVLGPGSWPDWWNLQGWRPIGRNEGCCPRSRTRPRMACSADCSSLRTSQPDRRKLRENRRAVTWCGNAHPHTCRWYLQQSVPLVGGGRSKQEPGFRGMATLHRDPVLSHSVYW